jgi:hypothetical protein
MTQQRPKSYISLLHRLPSFAWIIIFVLAIAGLIGGTAGACYVISHYEGAATLLMIGAAWIIIRLWSGLGSQAVVDTPSPQGSNLLVALCIAFYAAMGIAIDQPGNWLFNRPFQWFYCPAGTELQHGVSVSHPLPERTDITQDFSCVTKSDRVFVKRIGGFPQVWVRFVEYILVAYGLLGLNRLYTRIRRSAAPASSE